MKLLYFAWVREKTGMDSETLDLPDSVGTVGALAAWLRDRGDKGFAEAFADPSRLRAAVNEDLASFDTAVTNSDEVAFFPPLTGG
ncbi:MAG: molybdopterin converting factor subunit 1 [Rhodospirillaceae bacterium]